MQKKQYVVLGGYGEIGQMIVRDLLKFTADKIYIVGRDVKKAGSFAKSLKSNRVQAAKMDVTNINQLARFLRGKSVCINSTNYYFNLSVMKACLKAKVPYLDLGGLFHMTKRQLKLNSAFKKAKLLAILGCGATPGITNVMAAHGAQFLDRIAEIHVKFAGKDFTKYQQSFVLPYSPDTLFDEFSMPAAVFTKGKIKMVPAISHEGYEIFPKPIGKVNCGNMLHSEVATFPTSFKKKGLRECTFKAGFHESIKGAMQLLIKLDFAKKENRKHAVYLLNQFLPPKHIRIKDMEYLRVTLIGNKNKKRKKIILDCLSKSIPAWRAPAGTVDTAVPASVIAQMIVNGKIKKIGVFPPELCIPAPKFFLELKRRGIKVMQH